MKTVIQLVVWGLVLCSLGAVANGESVGANDWYKSGLEAKYRLKENEAIEHFEKAANLGHVRSQFELAMLLLNRELAAEVSHTESIKWLTKAANNGHSQAQYELAMFYMDEYENPESEKLVTKWMHAAAENHHQAAATWIQQNSKNQPEQ